MALTTPEIDQGRTALSTDTTTESRTGPSPRAACPAREIPGRKKRVTQARGKTPARTYSEQFVSIEGTYHTLPGLAASPQKGFDMCSTAAFAHRLQAPSLRGSTKKGGRA